jgi:hypothetical protein
VDRLRVARVAAQELAWADLVETRGGLPAASADKQPIPGPLAALDASIVICQSDKELAGGDAAPFRCLGRLRVRRRTCAAR